MLKAGQYIKAVYNHIGTQWHIYAPRHHGSRRMAWLAYLAVMPASTAVNTCLEKE